MLVSTLFLKLKSSLLYLLAFAVLVSVFSLSYFHSGNELPYTPTLLTMEIRTPKDETGQLYFDTGEGFIEEESVYFNLKGSHDYQTVRIIIPGRDISTIRIDPMMREGNFEIKSLKFWNPVFNFHLTDKVLAWAIVPLNQLEVKTTIVYGYGTIATGVSTGEDPFFIVRGFELLNELTPLYIYSIIAFILLISIIFLFCVKKFFFNYDKEILFAILLFVFALPIRFPVIPALLLYLSATILFFLLTKQYGDRKIILDSKWLDKINLLKSDKALYTMLFIFIVIAFLLRILNLNILDPYTDEYHHLMAAKEIIETGSTNYIRANLVSYLVALFYQIGNADTFYEYLYWGRMPGVIFSSLTVVPLFFLTKRISLTIALISSFLWATSPWAIGVAKTIREYAYYPFFIILASIALITLYDFILGFDKKNILKIMFLIITIVAFTYYAFFIDTASTLRIWAIVFAGISVYYLFSNINTIKKIYVNNKMLFIIIILSVIIIIMLMLNYRSGHVIIEGLVATGYSFNIFFNSTAKGMPMHWWGAYSYVFIGLFLFFIAFMYALCKKKNEHFLYFVIFLVLMLFYTFFFARYFRPRYIFYLLPYFIPIISIAIYGLVKLIFKIKHKWIKIFTAIILSLFLFQVFNYQNVIYPITSDRHGYIKTTNEHHDYLGSWISLLEDQISSDDYFITSIFDTVLRYHFNISADRISGYNYMNENRFDKVRQIISEHPQGFMILDWRRNGHFAEGFPHEGPFYVGNTIVEVIQNKDGIQVYRWEK